MSSSVEKIKEKLGIEEVVGSYIKLERAGNNLKARCPFHNEKTPSFFVSPDRNSYYCFGCGAKGDIFSFVQDIEGLDFRGALKLLAEKAGIPLETFQMDKKDSKDRIFDLLEEATKYFQSVLEKTDSALQYLEKRGLNDKTIKDWRIGFVPDEWRTVSDFLKKKGFTDIEMQRAGLIKQGEDGKNYYDRFRGRIMFPIFDSAGRVIAYSGRILVDDGKSAKYLNSPETEVFNKSKVLYGFHRAKQAIRKFDYTVLVEGQMDLLMSHQAGFANTVASSGTALTTEHLNLLKRISNRVIMAYDSDNAGIKAVEKAWLLALSEKMDIKVAVVGQAGAGKADPAEIILQSKDKWIEILKNSVNIIDFVLNNVLSENKDERKIAVAIKEKVLPYISLLDSNTEKAHYIKKISDKLNIKEDALWEDLKKIKVEVDMSNMSSSVGVDYNKIFRTNSIERRIFGIIFWQKFSPDKEFDKSVFDKLAFILGKEAFEKAISITKDGRDEMSFEAESYYSGMNEAELQKELLSLIRELQVEIYKKEQAVLLIELKKAEKDKDEEKKVSLAIRFNDISKKLNEIKGQK